MIFSFWPSQFRFNHDVPVTYDEHYFTEAVSFEMFGKHRFALANCRCWIVKKKNAEHCFVSVLFLSLSVFLCFRSFIYTNHRPLLIGKLTVQNSIFPNIISMIPTLCSLCRAYFICRHATYRYRNPGIGLTVLPS
jgi:hypothetical protein